jgi:hypothetical protein
MQAEMRAVPLAHGLTDTGLPFGSPQRGYASRFLRFCRVVSPTRLFFCLRSGAAFFAAADASIIMSSDRGSREPGRVRFEAAMQVN